MGFFDTGGQVKLPTWADLLVALTAAVPTYLSAAMIALKDEYPLLSTELNVDTSDHLIELLRDGRLVVPDRHRPDRHSHMIAVIPQSVANRFARHDLLRILPHTFTHTLVSRGSQVHRDRHINRVMRRFLDLMHANIVA